MNIEEIKKIDFKDKMPMNLVQTVFYLKSLPKNQLKEYLEFMLDKDYEKGYNCYPTTMVWFMGEFRKELKEIRKNK